MNQEQNKEQVYDARIAPLMDQIIAICKERQIGVVACFHIPNEDDENLHCTTALTTDEYGGSERLRRAVRGLHSTGSFAALTITNP